MRQVRSVRRRQAQVRCDELEGEAGLFPAKLVHYVAELTVVPHSSI